MVFEFRNIKTYGVTAGEHSLTKGQVEKLLGVTTDMRAKVLLEVAVTGGLRRDDVVNVRVDGIDTLNNSLTFREKKKGGKAHTVYLPGQVIQDMSMYSKIHKSEWLLPGASRGKHLCSKQAYNIFQATLKTAGLSPRPFHALRATCVKLCQAAGWSATATAKHLDDTLFVVEKHYSVPSVEERKATAQERAIL